MGLTDASRATVDTATHAFCTLTIMVVARHLMDRITANKIKRSDRATTKDDSLEVNKVTASEVKLAQFENLLLQKQQPV